ncbi:MAG: paraquat-inducible protein A [Pseudomonadota bacterium]
MSEPPPRSQWINTGLALLLAVIVGLSMQLIATLQTHQRLSEDLAELNKAKYGLLNADAWVEQVAAIIEKKINEFEITPDTRASLKLNLQRMLDTLITEADRFMRLQTKKESESGDWWGRTKGKVKLNVMERFVDIRQVKRGIPIYADKILDRLAKSGARQDLNQFLQHLMTEASRSTFSVVDQTAIEDIHTAYQCSDRPACQQTIGERMEISHLWAVQQTLALLALTTLLFAVAALTPGRQNAHRLAVLAVCCGVLMLCGVLTPMIEVEARISELRFVLLGEPVVFTDQVLYFQSKSVLDVVTVLTATGKFDMIVVGALIMIFSVIFPLAKLLASFAYLYDVRGLRQSSIVRFFALKSGKWSMADVFVVAMFMAYIGFNGIMASQLSNFAAAGVGSVDILTTNGTSLQIGFFMFLAFCIAGLLTSTLIDSAIEPKTPVA